MKLTPDHIGYIALSMGALVVIFYLYFLPTFIARGNNYPQKTAIFALNLFAAWTGLFWIIALVWACMKTQQQIMIEQRPPLERKEPKLY